jgi:hypothetical protein
MAYTGTETTWQDSLLKVEALSFHDTTPVTASTLAVSQINHAGRVIVLDRAAGVAATLPAATGTGDVYTFVVKTTASGGNYVVKVANATDVFNGSMAYFNDTGTAGLGKGWAAADSDDTVTLNGTTTGGYAGARVVCTDYASGFWSVQVFGKQSGSVATPFSATVS